MNQIVDANMDAALVEAMYAQLTFIWRFDSIKKFLEAKLH